MTLVDQIYIALGLHYPNTRMVLLAVSLLGLVAGTVGCFGVLRGRALLGDTLAHAALPGVCSAYLIVGDRQFLPFLLGAFAFGIIAVSCVSWLTSAGRIKQDAALAFTLSSFFGLGIVLSRIIQNLPGGNRSGLDSFIFGKAASLVQADLYAIVFASVVSFSVLALFFNHFKILCFDEVFASTAGIWVRVLDLVLMGLITLCTVVGLPAVGVVLVAALLVIPGAAARYWSDSLPLVIGLAGIFGMLSGASGALISAAEGSAGDSGIPTGPIIILSAASIFAISMLFAPKRGVVAQMLLQRSFQRSLTSARGPNA